MTVTTVPGPQPATITPARGDAGGGHPATGLGKDTRPGPPRPSGQAALGGLASVAINVVVPLLAYHVIRKHTDSSAMALALVGAIPVAWTLGVLAVRRKLSTLGVVSVILFGIGVLISWISGGSTLAIELQDPVVFGAAALACLVSIAVGHPLHQVILRAMGRSNPRYTQTADRAAASGSSSVATAIIGLAFFTHAVAVAVLALTQSTSTFLALQNPVGLPFLGLGVAGLFIYGTRQQARKRAAEATQPASDGQPADGQAPDGQAPDGQAPDGQAEGTS
jgi:hypothetical protein